MTKIIAKIKDCCPLIKSSSNWGAVESSKEIKIGPLEVICGADWPECEGCLKNGKYIRTFQIEEIAPYSPEEIRKRKINPYQTMKVS